MPGGHRFASFLIAHIPKLVKEKMIQKELPRFNKSFAMFDTINKL